MRTCCGASMPVIYTPLPNSNFPQLRQRKLLNDARQINNAEVGDVRDVPCMAGAMQVEHNITTEPGHVSPRPEQSLGEAVSAQEDTPRPKKRRHDRRMTQKRPQSSLSLQISPFQSSACIRAQIGARCTAVANNPINTGS